MCRTKSSSSTTTRQHDQFIEACKCIKRNDPTFRTFGDDRGNAIWGHLTTTKEQEDDNNTNTNTNCCNNLEDMKLLLKALEHNTVLEDVIINLSSFKSFQLSIKDHSNILLKLKHFLCNNQQLRILQVWINYSSPIEDEQIIKHLFHELQCSKTLTELSLMIHCDNRNNHHNNDNNRQLQQQQQQQQQSSLSSSLSQSPQERFLVPVIDFITRSNTIRKLTIKGLLRNRDMQLFISCLKYHPLSIQHIELKSLMCLGTNTILKEFFSTISNNIPKISLIGILILSDIRFFKLGFKELGFAIETLLLHNNNSSSSSPCNNNIIQSITLDQRALMYDTVPDHFGYKLCTDIATVLNPTTTTTALSSSLSSPSSSSSSLHVLSNLIELNLSGLLVHEEKYWLQLTNAIRYNKTLQKLKLISVGLGDDTMYSLVNSLLYNKTLKILNVSKNRNISMNGIKVFYNHLNVISLKEFYFGNYDIDWVKLIASNTKNTYTLTDISCMDILNKSERFYLDLNRNGRYYLYHDTISPIALWTYIFARMTKTTTTTTTTTKKQDNNNNNNNNIHLLYFFLRQKADLLASATTSR